MDESQQKQRKNIDPLLTKLTTSSSHESLPASNEKPGCIPLCKCIKCLSLIILCPLNIVTLPLVYLLDGFSCWQNKQYQQHDLSLQFVGICQNLVAVFWSNCLVSMVEYLLNEESLNIKDTNMTLAITTSYALSMYLLSILLIFLVSKLKFLSDRISFFLGLFVRIIAFGVKDLAFEIQDIYFAHSFRCTLSFFFIQLLVAIIFLISLSTLRSKLCPNRFNVTEMEESTDSKAQKKKVDHYKYGKLHQKRMAKKQRHKDLYEKRLLAKKREMHFNCLINKLDTDIWTISLGFCLVEVVICGLSGKWIPLEPSVVHQESIHDIDPMYFAYLFGSICLIWLIWLQCIAYFEMIRDRAYQKVFLMANYVQIGETNIDQYYDDYIIQFTNVLLRNCESESTLDGDGSIKLNYSNLSLSYGQNSISRKLRVDNSKPENMTYLLFPKRMSPTKTHKNSSADNGVASAADSNADSSEKGAHFEQLPFWYRFVFHSGFKYKNAMDRFVFFMDGILGWSMGWSMAGAIFVSHDYKYRLIYASIATAACILMEVCRNLYVHRNINEWYSISQKRRRLYKQTMTIDDVEHKQHVIDVTYFKDTVDFDQNSLDNAALPKQPFLRLSTAAPLALPEQEEVSPKHALIRHKSTMDESECASSINSAYINLSKFNLIEYIHRKTSVWSARQDSVATYLSSNLDITDPRKRHINLGIMSSKEHKAVYVYNHISVTCRKSIALVAAIVWSACIVAVLGDTIDRHIAFKYDLYLMLCITIFATYLGMKWTAIKTKYAGYSNADITKRFIEAYHADVLETRQNIVTKFQLH